MVGIYKITSPSNKVYIGQSWDVSKRKKDHRNWKGDTHLANSIKKYGFDNHLFEVVHELPNDVEQSVLDTYEQLYIDSYRDCGFVMMNLRDAGSRGKQAEESKRKQSEKMKGVGLGRKQSDDWVKKRTSVQIGNKNWLGKTHSEETKKKTSAALANVEKSPEHKIKCIENFKKATQARIRPVVQLSKDGEFIKEWPSAKDVELSGVALARAICAVCKGQKHYNTAGGFKWIYKKD